VKYLFIGKKFSKLGRGGFVVTKRFCETFQDKTKFIESSEITNKNDLMGYKKVIFRTQVSSAYNIPINHLSLRKFNYLVYVRNENLTPLLNSCTNGFYYYKANEKIKNYIPMITDFSVEETISDIPCLGFYIRNFITKDSFDWLLDNLKIIKPPINLYLMGKPTNIDFKIINKNIKNITHTYDNHTFFSNVTHYIYPRSKSWIDIMCHI
jgi:hypothetical protein